MANFLFIIYFLFWHETDYSYRLWCFQEKQCESNLFAFKKGFLNTENSRITFDGLHTLSGIINYMQRKYLSHHSAGAFNKYCVEKPFVT